MESAAVTSQHEAPPVLKARIARRLLWGAVLAVGILFAAVLVRRCFSFAVFPDELYCLDYVCQWNDEGSDLRKDEGGGLMIPNHFGYGSSWWMLIDRLYREFQPRLVVNRNSLHGTFPMITPRLSEAYSAIYFGRICSLAALLGSFVFAIASVRGDTNRLLMCGLLLLPFVGWNGKWMSPDFVAIACAVLAASQLSRHMAVGALFFLGAAAGLRLSNLFMLSGFIVLALSYQKLSLWAAAKSVVAFAVGYVLANPIVLTDWPLAIENAAGAPGEQAWWTVSWEAMGDCLFGSRIEWDLASTGSILYWWGGALLPTTLGVLLIKSKNYRLLAAIAFSFAVGILAVGMRGFGYGWYFMPTIAATCVLSIAAIPIDSWSPPWRRGAIAALCLGFLISGRTSYLELRVNRHRERVLLRHQVNEERIQAALKRKPYDTLWLLTDPASTMFDLPGKKFEILLDSLPRLKDPESFDLSRAIVITTKELEQPGAPVHALLQHLRRSGARIEEFDGVVIAW